MITRLEIDGFKSFADFAVDIPPFVAIVGPNASGKSNLFDAMALLSRIVTASTVSDALGSGRGQPAEQFRRRRNGTFGGRMTLAVEVLLDVDVSDAFGTTQKLTHTRLRYEVVVEMRADAEGLGRPFIASEEVSPISRQSDRWAESVGQGFSAAHLVYAPRLEKILTTEENDGKSFFRLASRWSSDPGGRSTKIPADRAVRSALGSIVTASDHPLLYALRREIERWRFLHLEPSALRMPSVEGSDGERLGSDGANLPLVLEAIERSSISEGTAGLDALAGDLARIIRGFSGVVVRHNDVFGVWELWLASRDETHVSARVASDGTLRVIAVLAALYEQNPGVLCVEEPENGVDPQRLMALLDVLRDLVTDPDADDHQAEDGLAQHFVSSHSPLLSQYVQPSELVVVDSVSLMEPGIGASRITRARRVLDGDGRSPRPEPDDDQTWGSLPPSVQTEVSGITREVAERVLAQG